MNFLRDIALNIINYIDAFVEYFSAPVYHLLILLLYITYIIAIIGITYINPNYTRYLSILIQSFIALVLMIRFNPLRKKINCDKNDKTLTSLSKKINQKMSKFPIFKY